MMMSVSTLAAVGRWRLTGFAPTSAANLFSSRTAATRRSRRSFEASTCAARCARAFAFALAFAFARGIVSVAEEYEQWVFPGDRRRAALQT